MLGRINADAFNQALYGYLEIMPPAAADELPEVTRREREQRRAAAAARGPAVPGLLPQAAADGKTARGAVRPDGSQVHLLSAFHVTEGRTMAQREVDAKTNEIPELGPMLEELDLQDMVITADALHGQRETARKIREDLHAHYLLFIKRATDYDVSVPGCRARWWSRRLRIRCMGVGCGRMQCGMWTGCRI